MTQEEALKIMKTGANVFLTGAPGAGKTYVLNQYIEFLKDHQIPVAITATTGIASTHIGGQTIHSWSGIGTKSFLTDWDIDNLLQKKPLWDRFQKTKVLIIDEISMLEASFFNSLDLLARSFKRSDKPFGDMQIILVGDFFQLPPVVKNNNFKFAIESSAWKNLKPLICYLENQYRQDDEKLLEILTRIRSGEDLEYIAELLQDRIITESDNSIVTTKLFTHNLNVDDFNNLELKKLNSQEKFFKMSYKGKEKYVERLVGGCLSPEVLHLKIGALVMCTKNNTESGYVNGTVGKVAEFNSDGFPVIETNNGKRITIEPKTWTAFDDTGRTLATIEQIPLRLAWAITVHKSQGMTIDSAEIDLSNSFSYGQGYVALSRVKSLDGLFLRGFNNMSLMVHPKISAVDEILRRQSDKLVDYLSEKTDQELSLKAVDFIKKSGGIVEPLSKEEKEKLKKPKAPTTEETLLFVLDKKTIDEISLIRGLTVETILGHIEKLIKTDKLTIKDLEYLIPKKKKDRQRMFGIILIFQELKTDMLTTVKNKAGDDYSFLEIRIARLFKDIDNGLF